MASTDKFNKVLSGTTRPVATTLSAQKLSGATSASVVATTGWETSTAVHGIMYRTDGNGAKVAGSQIDFKADVSGTTLNNFTVTAGTDDTYAIGTTVELSPTAAWGDDMATGILVEHDQDGTHTDVTADSISVAENIDMVDGKSIRDGNNNELIKVSQTASAVNEVTVANAATGNAPQISATGGDTNIDLRIVPKGTGYVKKGTTGGAIDWYEELGRTTLGSAGDSLSVSFTAKKYLKFYWYIITSGATNLYINFNSDTGSNYANRNSDNGAADTTSTSQTRIGIAPSGTAQDSIGVGEMLNYTSSEKIGFISTTRNTAGAGTAPGARRENILKWANTSSQISSIQLTNDAAGDLGIGSEIVVLGHD